MIRHSSARRATAVLALVGALGVVMASGAVATPVRAVETYGFDRYSTSANADSDPTRPAYIVSGENFPDGLTASALAALDGGNVYLTPTAQLTKEVRERVIYASKITVVGGEASVGKDVMIWLQQNTKAPLKRIVGADRYGTAAAVATANYAAGVSNVVIATGEDFPDALTGGAAAGHARSPLLLTTRDELPASTIAALQVLQPKAITVIGGVNRVSESVRQQLEQFVSDGVAVSRVSGADRYETAVEVSKSFFDSANLVVLASGAKFPDALSAGARAARFDAPLLLSPGNCLSENTNLEIERVQFGKPLTEANLEAIGGPTTLTIDALKRTNCQPSGMPAKTYLDQLAYPVGGAKYQSDHATINGHFYPRSAAFDTDALVSSYPNEIRNSEYRTWKLGTKYSRFTMTAGVDDLNNSGLVSTVDVYGDEKLLASRQVRLGSPSAFDLDVRGIDNLKIVTTTTVPSNDTSTTVTGHYVYFGDAAVS
jgi:putative cell wall-binding protein